MAWFGFEMPSCVVLMSIVDVRMIFLLFGISSRRLHFRFRSVPVASKIRNGSEVGWTAVRRDGHGPW